MAEEDINLDWMEITKSNQMIRDLIAKFLCQSKSIDEVKAPLDNVKNNLPIINEIGKILEKTKSLTATQKSILNLFLYLSLTEGIFSELVNSITFMHIHSQDKFIYLKDDKETKPIEPIFSKWKKTYVYSYEEIKDLDLFVKLEYLGNKYKTSWEKNIADCVNRDLRNSVAHLDYLVNDDGTVIYGKKREKVNSEQEVKSLMTNIYLIFTDELQPLVQTVLKQRRQH